MLIIDKDIDGKIFSRSWTQGQMSSMVRDARNKEKVLDCSNVVSVQADGGELDHIISRFKNFPYCSSGNTMSWYGDMAKFIVGNWI